MAFLTACTTRSSPIPSAEARDTKRAVVVELYSSEGCSSCPPADILLQKLAQTQPNKLADIIAIEEHVDYWNYLGWVDPFSSARWSERQREYSKAMGHRSVYTPQAVIDGHLEIVGSDREGLLEAIEKARAEPKAQIALTREGETLRWRITGLPKTQSLAEVFLAITEAGLSTAVPRGENAGVTVAHAPIARSMEKVGTIGVGKTGFAGEQVVKRLPGWKKEKLSAVVIVQETGKRAILGAAAIPWE